MLQRLLAGLSGDCQQAGGALKDLASEQPTTLAVSRIPARQHVVVKGSSS